MGPRLHQLPSSARIQTAWIGRRHAGSPVGRFVSEHELQLAALGKDVILGHPAPVPVSAIDLERLHVEAVLITVLRGDLEALPIAKIDRQIGEPR